MNLQELIQLVNQSDIASIRNSIVEILRLVGDPHTSAKQLTELIERDPPLSGKILRRANSVFYGSTRKISEIRQAIVRVGFDVVKELTLSQKVCELFEYGTRRDGFSRMELWKNSVAVALCAKFIYRQEFGHKGEEAYAAGILHNIGIVVEDQFMHNQFLEVIDIKPMMKDNILNAESSVFGYNHAIIAGDLLENWNLPVDLVSAVRFHHAPFKADNEIGRIVQTLYMADYLCQGHGIGFCDTPYGNRLMFRRCLSHLDIKEKATDYIIQEVVAEIKKMENAGWFG